MEEVMDERKPYLNNISPELIKTMLVEKSQDTLLAEKQITKQQIILNKNQNSKQSLNTLEDNLRKNGILSCEINLKTIMGQWSTSSLSDKSQSPESKSSPKN
jgi:hypothetical protein